MKNQTTNYNEISLANELKNLAENYNQYKDDTEFVSKLNDLINEHSTHSSLIYYVMHRQEA